VAAAETLNAGFYHPAKDAEDFCVSYLFLVLLAIFGEFASFGLLHALNEVPEKLMRILLPAKFELTQPKSTFLKIFFRLAIMLLGAKQRFCLVLAKTFSISQKTHHSCTWHPCE